MADNPTDNVTDKATDKATEKRQDPDPRAWGKTRHNIGDSNVRPFGLDIHNPVFLISSVVIAAFVLISLANQDATASFFGWLRPWLTSTFDWFLVLSVDAITLFCLVLIFHPVGKVRIGGKDAKPDYSYAGWIAMMFAAGIGIGLLFFGVLEPVYYNFAESGAARPLGIGTEDNEYIGVVGTIHHWGLEGWAVYAAVGLSLGIFSYNLGYPLTCAPPLCRFSANVSGGHGAMPSIRRLFSPPCLALQHHLALALARLLPACMKSLGSPRAAPLPSC